MHIILLFPIFSDARNEEARGPVVIDNKRQDDLDNNLTPDKRPDTSDLSTRILHFSYVGLAILGE